MFEFVNFYAQMLSSLIFKLKNVLGIYAFFGGFFFFLALIF